MKLDQKCSPLLGFKITCFVIFDKIVQTLELKANSSDILQYESLNRCNKRHKLSAREAGRATFFPVCNGPGVNFTSIQRAAFMSADPKSAKKLLDLTVFFALLGSAHIKAARRMLVKLTLAGVSPSKRCFSSLSDSRC